MFLCSGFSNMLSSSGSFITKLIKSCFMFPFFFLRNDNKTVSNIDGNIKQRR